MIMGLYFVRYEVYGKLKMLLTYINVLIFMIYKNNPSIINILIYTICDITTILYFCNKN